jgi:hypothetical protein
LLDGRTSNFGTELDYAVALIGGRVAGVLAAAGPARS